MSAPAWFYQLTTLLGTVEEIGPVEQKEMVQLARAGKLARDTLVCCPTKYPDRWFHLAQVPGLLKAVETGDAERAEARATADKARQEQREAEQRALVVRQTADAERAAIISEGQDCSLILTVAERVQGILIASEVIRFIVLQQRPVVNISPDAAVITNRRLILYRPKLLGRFSFEDYPLFDLHDVHLEQSYLSSIFTARHTSGRVIRIDWLPKGPAQRLYRLAQELEEQARMARIRMDMEMRRAGASQININNMQAPPQESNIIEATVVSPSQPSNDPMQRLKTLKEMLENELISQEEFDGRKKQILAEI